MAQSNLKLQEIRELQLRLNNAIASLSANRTSLGARGPLALTDFTPPTTTQGISTPSQIRNGDFSHSVNTWNDVAPDAGDRSHECAFWFSHDIPVAAQTLNEATAPTLPNKTLKFLGHTQYDALFCDWDRPNGQARLTGTKSLDAPLPSNTAVPSRTMCVPFIAALRNSQIVVPSNCLIYAGIWDNTAGQRDWLKASAAFTLSGSVTGTPAATTERRYKVLAKTDRGYTFLSSELTLVGAPANGSFVPNEVYISLSWQPIVGILEYDIYRFNVVAGTYDLVAEIGNGSITYLDQNSIVPKAIAGYPTGTDDRAKAYVATRPGNLDEIAVNGVSPKWTSFFLNIPVPGGQYGYNQGNTTDKQWLRLGLTVALDRQVADAHSTSGSNSVSSASGFTALDTGRMATLTDGTNVHGPEVITYVDATHVTFATNVAFNSSAATLYIVGGGDQGLLVDLVHLSYVPNAVYAPYPEDTNRPQQPNAAPNGSYQGGIGQGGTGEGGGEGGPRCVSINSRILVLIGEEIKRVPFADVREGDLVLSGDLLPNKVMKIIPGNKPLHRIRTKNGCELLCSSTHRLITGRGDGQGTPASRLQSGDYLLTWRRGRIERSEIVEISEAGNGEVGTFILSPGHIYIAENVLSHNVKLEESAP